MGDPAQVFDGYVGREGPRARFAASFRYALAGNARLVLVSGEAGIGKTSLLVEAVRAMGERDAVAVWGTCWDAERAPGYWPWTQALRELVRRFDGDLVEDMSDAERVDLGRLVPELNGDGPAATPEELDSERARLRCFDVVARLLERAARRRPVIVALDDLQWADSSSLDLLEFLVRGHRPVPLLVLGAYRRDELRDDAARALTSTGARAEHVSLRGLSPTEVRELVRGVAGNDLAERWSALVHRRTGGHPFLVRELAHAIALDPRGGTAADIPDAAHDLIERRIGRLSSDCRRLLDAAAVAGNDLLVDVLGDVLELTPAAIAALVDDANTSGVVVAAPDGRTRFAHDLYRETLYADLPLRERLAWHQRVGTALEQRRARGGTVFAGQVARHFAAAAALDGPERAIRWALIAATDDRNRLAFAEAAAQLARVRFALDEAGVAVSTTVLVDLLVAQADAESRAGAPDEARQLLRNAHASAEPIDDPERLAVVALGFQRLGARYGMPRTEVVALLEEARLAVEGRSQSAEAEVTASLARELWHSVPRDRARAGPLSEHAVTLARELGDPATLATCLLARHDVLWTPGAGAERAEVAREIVALGERSGNDERTAEGHLLCANALLEVGSPAFRVELDAFLRLEDRFGQPRHDYLALTRRAAIALLHGSLDEGERLLHKAAGLGERIGEPDVGNVRMSQLLEVARARGEPDELRHTAQMAIDWWVGIPSHAHAVAAGLFAQAGDLDAARRALDTVIELGTWREDRSYMWSVFAGSLTVAAVRLGDHDLSKELLEEFRTLTHACAVNGAVVCFMGSHAHSAGIAAAAIGQLDQAQDFFLDALVVHERLGARAWEAETCTELAELLGEDGAPYRARAMSLAADLSLAGLTARLAASATPRLADSVDAACRHDGELWYVAYRGRSVHLRDAKGLHDLAALLARPGANVHVLDLADSSVRDPRSSAPALDSRARADYRRRIAELDDDLAEAEAHHDLGQIERVEAERELVIAELRRATDHTGKDRGLGITVVERARKAVTGRLRDAIRRIEAGLPELGAHLDRSIVTGILCRYQPTEPLSWDLQPLPDTSRRQQAPTRR